jgi:hypothetical protein
MFICQHIEIASGPFGERDFASIFSCCCRIGGLRAFSGLPCRSSASRLAFGVLAAYGVLP